MIDDDPVMLHLFKNVLHHGGYEVLIAENGLKGIELAASEMPVLIVLDYVMPDLDGLETLKRLKSRESTRDIPVVMLTGHLDDKTSTQFIAARASACFPKPFDPAALLSLVQKLIPARIVTDDPGLPAGC